LGTRLTRLTRALRVRNQSAALAGAAAIVSDWDGGTRLGATLAAFLASPRWLNLVRGAAVIVISDALERGDPQELVHAVDRLHRLAWRLSWATPLAADPLFRPETEALRAMLPALDDLVNGADVQALADFTLSLASPAPYAQTVWSKRHSLS